jgi:polyhydroxybutyrate depolymerase
MKTLSKIVSVVIVAHLGAQMPAAYADNQKGDICHIPPGTYERSLEWEVDGIMEERPFEVYVPESVDTPAPVVFNLHPYIFGGHPVMRAGWARESQYKATADANGFIVIQPNGTGSPLTSWNGGLECCSPASDSPTRPGVDDVGFLQAIAAQLATETCIDTSRIYATGMSNGGYLSHRLACEAPGFIAAIAPVVGSFSKELVCTTERGIPVLQVSGAEDSLPGRTASVDRWKSLNQCNDGEGVTYQEGEATCTTWSGCTDEVEVTHCILPERGHCWFSDLDPQLTPGCPPTEEFNSQDVTWEFLSRWTLPSD